MGLTHTLNGAQGPGVYRAFVFKLRGLPHCPSSIRAADGVSLGPLARCTRPPITVFVEDLRLDFWPRCL